MGHFLNSFEQARSASLLLSKRAWHCCGGGFRHPLLVQGEGWGEVRRPLCTSGLKWLRHSGIRTNLSRLARRYGCSRFSRRPVRRSICEAAEMAACYMINRDIGAAPRGLVKKEVTR